MMFVFLCTAVAFILESRLAGVNNKQFCTIKLGREPNLLCQVLHFKATSSVTACFVTEFSCCVLCWNITTQYGWLT